MENKKTSNWKEYARNWNKAKYNSDPNYKKYQLQKSKIYAKAKSILANRYPLEYKKIVLQLKTKEKLDISK